MSDKTYDICCGDASVPTLKNTTKSKKEAHNTIVKSFEELENYKPASATVKNHKWYSRYLRVADTYAKFSKDPSTKTGAVIVDKNKRIVSAGFNGFPSGIHDTDGRLNDRDTKYKLILHAEENALMCSTQDLSGCTIFVSPLPPCMRCCLLIIQSGITRVVAPALTEELEKRWGASCKEAYALFKEAGVKVVLI